MRSLWICVLAAWLLPGCPSRSDDPDSGPAPDGAVPDSAPRDGGARDGGARDGGARDAGGPDEGAADAAAPDAAPADAAVVDDDAGPPAPPPESAPPPLFDAQGDPLDRALAGLIDGWHARPTTEAEAQAQARGVLEARRQLEAEGAAAADRIVEKCMIVPLRATADTMVCLRLLSLVESPASVDFLAERARLRVPPLPEGAHPVEPPPEDLARQVATWSLGQRARAGSRLALDRLLQLVADPENEDRQLAVDAVFGALPRVRAKARLKAVLPTDESYRLYTRR